MVGFNNEYWAMQREEDFIAATKRYGIMEAEAKIYWLRIAKKTETPLEIIKEKIEELQELIATTTNDASGNESPISGNSGSDAGESAGNGIGAEGLPDRIGAAST